MLIVAVFAVIAALGRAAPDTLPWDIIQDPDNPGYYDNEGDMNDGRWWCSWMLDGFDCRDGEFRCQCNNDHQTHFRIGCCYVFPACGRICNTHDCSRYRYCQQCKTGIHEWEYNDVCHSCVEGHAIGSGDCKEDINECTRTSTPNGNCEHTCHNTYGSYYCTCLDGYQLEADQHSCLKLKCDDPGAIENGVMVATDEFFHDSWVSYSCDPGYTLVGYANRQCRATGTDMFWQGDTPTCVNKCTNVPLEMRRGCGHSGTSPEQCAQLGCCYQEAEGAPSCYHDPEPLFLRYAGERPTPNDGDGFRVQEESNFDGCAIDCAYGSNLQCAAMGVLQEEINEHGIQPNECHLFSKSRRQYIADGEMGEDPDFNFYDPLDFGARRIDQDVREAKPKDKLHQGCYAEPMEHLVAERDANNPKSCIQSCRQQGYFYAGLRKGKECHCSNNHFRPDNSTACTTPCPGYPDSTCGSEEDEEGSDVYIAPRDKRYVGCYLDITNDRDLPFLLWTKDQNKQSAAKCIDECMLAGYNFAGVQNGGDCYCGNDYGSHGDAEEGDCYQRCEGWADENCGGEDANAVYNTAIAIDISEPINDPDLMSGYIDDQNLAEIPLRLFTTFPEMTSIVTPRIVLYATEGVLTPLDDESCSNNCYLPCGSIYHPDEIKNLGSDVIIRQFFVRMSELDTLVGGYAERVYVFAQTVLIDTNADLDYSIAIRARQIIVDRSQASFIRVDPTKPSLYVDLVDPKNWGPESDLLFQKQSYMCARILLDTHAEDNTNTAWSMIHDLATDRSYNVEQADWLNSVRMFKGELSGIERSNVRFVPFYTKNFLSQVLEIYQNTIEVYADTYNSAAADNSDQDEFIKHIDTMLTIHVSTNIIEADRQYQASVDGVKRSNATYHMIYDNYNTSRTDLDEAKEAFEDGLREYEQQKSAEATFGFIKGIAQLVWGLMTFDPNKIQESLESVGNNVADLAETMNNLAIAMEKIERMMEAGDAIMAALEELEGEFDFMKYAGDLEMVAALEVVSVKWENLKHNAEIILTHPEIIQIGGCRQYRAAILDICNWGQALSRAMVEHAENLRECVRQRFLLDSKLEQAAKYQEYLDELKNEQISNEYMLYQMAVQQYDIRLDLNELLLVFCRAVFYENLAECSPGAQPSFGGSLSNLLVKIDIARRDAIFSPDVPQTVQRKVYLRDAVTNDDDEECFDPEICPVKFFKENRILNFKIDLDRGELEDLDKYRVGELRFDIVGADHQGTGQSMKLRMESSGAFKNRYRNDVYNFMTRALAVTYEYDLDDGEIYMYANVYEPYRNTVQHITPYTQWVLRVSEDRSSEVNLDDVSEIVITFMGSAIDGEPKEDGLQIEGIEM